MAEIIDATRTVSPNEAKSRLLRAFAIKKPVFLWGPPGIGKSDIIASLAKQLGGHMIDMRLAQMDPTDLKGLPHICPDTRKMKFSPSSELPTPEFAAKFPIVILFLDEMSSAPPSTQAVSYQLIQDRAIGEYKLPDNVVIVAAGNRVADKGVSYNMPSPLSNRFTHLEVRADYESWNDWAIENRQHPDVVGYIGYSKDSLMKFDPRSPSHAFSTPRSWSTVSKYCYLEDISTPELYDLVAGTVGDGMASAFMTHRSISTTLPNPTDILSGKVKTLDTTEISAMYSLIVTLCYELKDGLTKHTKENNMDLWHAKMDFYIEYIMANFKEELIVMGIRLALTTYKLPLNPMKLKNFAAFNTKYKRFVLAANGVNPA